MEVGPKELFQLGKELFDAEGKRHIVTDISQVKVSSNGNVIVSGKCRRVKESKVWK